MAGLKILAGLEDLLLDGDSPYTQVQQIRNNQMVLVTKINSHTIPVSGQYGKTGFESINSRLVTTAERTKLAGLPSNANYYTHPTSHPLSMIKVPTGNSGKFVKATGCCLILTDITWDNITQKPTSFPSTSHAHSQYTTPAEVAQLIQGKSNIGHLHDLNQMSGTIPAAQVEENCSRLFMTKAERLRLQDVVTKDMANEPNGYVELDSNGNLPCSAFRQINIGRFVPVDSEAEMLAITHTCTDNNCVIAIRNDYTGALGTYPMYALTALPATTLANWKGVNVAVSVNSVNGQTGNVVLCTDDVAEGVNNLYYSEDRVYNYIKAMFSGNGANCGLEFNDTSKTVNMLCGFIKRPSILIPTANQIDFRATITSSPYENKDIYVGTHDTSDWEIYSDIGLTTKVDSYSGAANLVSWDSTYINSHSNSTLYVRVRYISDTFKSDWSDAVCFTTPAVMIQAPTLTVTANATNMNLATTITGSAFALIGAGAGITDTHLETDWEIRKSSDNALVWSSIANSVNLTTITVPFGMLAMNTIYKVRARYRGANYGI